MPKPKKGSKGKSLLPNKDGLTDRMRTAAEHYLKTFNKTQSLIVAGYSVKSSRQQTSKVFANVYMQAYIQKRLTEILSTKNIDGTGILDQLISLGFSNIRSFIYYDPDGSLRFHQLDELPPIVTAAVESIKFTRKLPGYTSSGKVIEGEERIELKLRDAIKPLIELGRKYGVLKDKLDSDLSVIQNNVFFVGGFKKSKEAPVPKEAVVIKGNK